MATQERTRGDRPTDDVMTAVRESVAVLGGASQPFTRACYQELIALVPAILQNAADHGHGVAEELTTHVFWAATCDDPTSSVVDRLGEVGARLYQSGFPIDGYQGAAHALLRVARDRYPQVWDSSLSSAWVAYLSWAGDQMSQGAAIARSRGVQMPSANPAALAAVPASLTEVYQALHTGPFAGNDKALDLVATRIALRTGADIRFPRMDQQGDAALVAVVLGALGRMGYDVGAPLVPVQGGSGAAVALPEPPPTWDAVVAAGSTPAPAPVDPPAASPRKARWWNRRQRPVQAAPTRQPGPPSTASPSTAQPWTARPATAPAGLPLGSRGWPVPVPSGAAMTPSARGTFDAFSRLADAPAADPVTAGADADGQPRTLTEVHDRLRSGVFLGNEWAMEGVLTRVALRTGADIRAPRPDQVSDPAVVREVLGVLRRMGYGELSGTVTERPRWWSRQRRRERIA